MILTVTPVRSGAVSCLAVATVGATTRGGRTLTWISTSSSDAGCSAAWAAGTAAGCAATAQATAETVARVLLM